MNDLAVQHTQLMPTTDPAAVAAGELAKQRLQAGYTIAIQKPRNQEQARQNLLAACRRLRFAEKAEYSKPVGNQKISGPSIRFAETALREWGNIRSDIAVVYEDQTVRRIQVNMIDFETNSQFTKELSISKTVERRNSKGREVVGERENTYGDTVYIVLATDDELSNKEAAAISKAVRNEGLRLIPSDIIDEALDTARETMAKEIKENPDSNKRKVIDAFGTIGVKVKALEEYLGHDMDVCSPSEIGELRSIFSSIKDGESSWTDYLALKRKSHSDDPEERKSAEDAIRSMATKKPKNNKRNRADKKKESEPKSEPAPPAPTKGALIGDVMGLLNTMGRDQVDLIRWAVQNKHLSEEVATIQEFDTDLLQKIIANWDKIVL